MLLSNLRFTLVLLCTFAVATGAAQTVEQRLSAAFAVFEKDAQLRNAIASLYVVNVKTGAVVFVKNERTGLAPASTQKIITAASAYELLGKDFRYKTNFSLARNSKYDTSNYIFIKPSGDPTLGSWRWAQTKETNVVQRLTTAVRKQNVSTYNGLIVDVSGWTEEAIPDGWIWQDIGNYYGAGAGGVNWQENQYDLSLSSGNDVGSPVTINAAKPQLYDVSLSSEARAAAKGSGDNAYLYFVPGTNKIIVRGTIPAGEKSFVISGALPAPQQQFIATLKDGFKRNGVAYKETDMAKLSTLGNGNATLFHTETSPPLDSIIYWFNKKSINLYGEALIKTIAYQKKGAGSTDEGVAVVKDFWQSKGIEKGELTIVDGSGLSPLNRVTTHAQVQVLQYAKKQPWFGGFYLSLPEYNSMKLKSGTIRGVKGFCGYHTAKDGTEYAVSFLVNNYSGAASGVVMKMYKVLDVLK